MSSFITNFNTSKKHTSRKELFADELKTFFRLIFSLIWLEEIFQQYEDITQIATQMLNLLLKKTEY